MTPAQKSTYDAIRYAARRDEMREQRASYYADHREEAAARNATYRADHRDELRAYDAAYHATHREEKRAYDSARLPVRRAEFRAYREAHREQRAARKAAWDKAHPDRYTWYAAKRRGAPTCDHPACLVIGATQLAWQLNPHECYICRVPVWRGVNLHMDHVIPVSKGGIHCADNLRPTCGHCNQHKGTRIEHSQ